MNLHYTAEQIAQFPPANVAQWHDVGEEADERLQQGLHDLADRSQPPEPPITIVFCTMPEEAGQ